MSIASFRTELLDKLSEAFNDEELRELTWRLGVEYEDLGGRGRRATIREFIARMERVSRLDELTAELHKTRPDTEWPDPPEEGDKAPRDRAREQLPIFSVPHRRNRNFSGREAQLSEIEQTLAEGETILAIAGLGGLGKTQLALEFCYRQREAYDLIYWLPANELAALGPALAVLAGELGLASIESGNQALLRRLLFSRLEELDGRWLLIYDNADDIEPGDLSPYLPGPAKDHHILITSRNPDFRSIAGVLEPGIFKEEEALAFLKKRTGCDDREGAGDMAEALDYLPLALEHAAAYVEQTGVNFTDYLGYFKEQRETLWAESEPPDAYHATINTTWELNLEQLADQEAAIQLLELCSFLAPDDIPINLLREVAAGENLPLPDALCETLEDPLALNRTISALGRYSLLERTGDSLEMHRLVQAVMRGRMDEERAVERAALAVNLLLGAFPDNLVYTWHTWSEGSRLLAHAAAAAGCATRRDAASEQVALLYNATGYYLRASGDYAAAREPYERALAINEKVLGAEHPDTAVSLNNLGGLLQAQGEYEAAREPYERALAIREKVLGVEHPDTAESLNDLGLLLKVLEEYEEAQSYYERAIAIRQKKLGPDHPQTATCLNNLGALLRKRGKYGEALRYYKRALEIREEKLGPSHPRTATSLNNLGVLMRKWGKYKEARSYHERALAIREEVLGAEHPATATSLNNLGFLLQRQGEYEAAKGYYERALAIRERKLGPEHPKTKIVRGNLDRLVG